MKKVFVLMFGLLAAAMVAAADPVVFVILGKDDGGRYYAEDYGVSLEKAGSSWGGTRMEYKPGMKVYPNAPGGKYRLWFYGRDDSEKKNDVIPFYFWKREKISNWTINFNYNRE
jgi:hypothetical protein